TTHTFTHSLSLHDALPILRLFLTAGSHLLRPSPACQLILGPADSPPRAPHHGLDTTFSLTHSSYQASMGKGKQRPGGELVQGTRSEEHTSELQSRVDLVCR